MELLTFLDYLVEADKTEPRYFEMHRYGGKTGSGKLNLAYVKATSAKEAISKHNSRVSPDKMHLANVYDMDHETFHHPVTGKKKNDQFENFQDGRNPQDKGDMARHGLKGKSIAQLKKVRGSKTASPRSKQLAHWFINMHKPKQHYSTKKHKTVKD
jgi:hypothetical protein